MDRVFDEDEELEREEAVELARLCDCDDDDDEVEDTEEDVIVVILVVVVVADRLGRATLLDSLQWCLQVSECQTQKRIFLPEKIQTSVVPTPRSK